MNKQTKKQPSYIRINLAKKDRRKSLQFNEKKDTELTGPVAYPPPVSSLPPLFFNSDVALL